MIGYAFGNSQFVSFEKNLAHVRIPDNTSAVISMRLMRSGKISIKLGKNSKLIFSSLCSSSKDLLSIDYSVITHEKSFFAHTINSQGSNVSMRIRNDIGEGARNTLNAIALRSRDFSITVNSVLRAASSNILNLLVDASGDSRVTTDLLHSHIGDDSSSEITCSGIVSQSSCAINSLIAVNDNAKNVSSAFKCKLMNLAGSNINVVPALAVHSNNANVAHEVAVEDVTEEALAYFQSRGIAKPDAVDELKRGIMMDMINRMGEAFEQ